MTNRVRYELGYEQCLIEAEQIVQSIRVRQLVVVNEEGGSKSLFHLRLDTYCLERTVDCNQ